MNKMIERAWEAYQELRKTNFQQRKELMYAIADEIEVLGDELIQAAHEETFLPIGRLTGEKGRTVFQWRSYADALASGQALQVRIDTALPDRTPPRVDIRKSFIGLGPVVVFGASNFPFAFSTAGGDTASAIAAGCPVIVKAHYAHPKTAKIMEDAIKRGIVKAGGHPGIFDQIFLQSNQEAQELITYSKIKAVSFTGSLAGGRALYDAAQKRPEPIPVFAEMGSVNPVFVLPEKLKNHSSELAKQYVGSLTLGAGQFCTNPGLLVIPEGQEEFLNQLLEEIHQAEPDRMLHEGIAEAYHLNKKKIMKQKPVTVLYDEDAKGYGPPAVATVSATDFIENPDLQEEVFGPFSLVITYRHKEELSLIAKSLEGQLTATIWAEESELDEYRDMLTDLTGKCGRLLYNGFPTGVEVVTAMQHGGPYPASTDSRFTSVGSDAIKRFARPIAFQNIPDAFLPDELKNSNPLGLYRLVNGEINKKEI